MARSALTAALAAIVGTEHVLADPDVRAGYEEDWTRRFRGRARVVVRPGSTDEVAALVRWCCREGVPLVPQGGNTGLVGGSVPDATGQSVVVSTRRLDGLHPVDREAGQVTAQAGVTLAVLEASLTGSPWEFGVDLGARAEATIGGMVATNAGGMRVLRHGSMRNNVLGVEAVLGDGSVVSHLEGLVKDNTGYDLAGLLCGSEGTLGVVTAARLRLVPRWPDRVAVWMACDGWGQAVERAAALRAQVEGLDALEAMDGPCQVLAERLLGSGPVLVPRPPVALLAVWAGRGDPPSSLVDVASATDNVVAVDDTTVARFWAPRERMAEAIAREGVPHKLDVTLPMSKLADFAAAVSAEAGLGQVHLFGHLGDGNLHVNLLGARDDADERVLRLVADYGGSISAEHGVGRHKVPWLHLSRTPAELQAFASIKQALDPAGIMNPGVLLASGPQSTH